MTIMDYLANNIAVNLKSFRQHRGMSLDQIADRTGVSTSMLAQIERGQANPSIGVLCKIASGLQMDFEDLVRTPAVTASSEGNTSDSGPSIKTVIFDIDNTLYSYDENHVYGMKALADYCESAFGIHEQEMESCYKKAGEIMIGRIGTDTAAIHSRLLRMQCMLELWEKPLFPHARNMYHAYWDTLIRQLKPSPGVLDFMRELKKCGISIGVGTDMTAYIQYRKLEAIGASPYIDFIVTSEEAGVEKPHPHLFEICVEKSGVQAAECAFIGDNYKKDVEGAWNSGLRGIWYTQEKEPDMEIKYPVIRSFTDMKKIKNTILQKAVL